MLYPSISCQSRESTLKSKPTSNFIQSSADARAAATCQNIPAACIQPLEASNWRASRSIPELQRATRQYFCVGPNAATEKLLGYSHNLIVIRTRSYTSRALGGFVDVPFFKQFIRILPFHNIRAGRDTISCVCPRQKHQGAHPLNSTKPPPGTWFIFFVISISLRTSSGELQSGNGPFVSIVPENKGITFRTRSASSVD